MTSKKTPCTLSPSDSNFLRPPSSEGVFCYCEPFRSHAAVGGRGLFVNGLSRAPTPTGFQKNVRLRTAVGVAVIKASPLGRGGSRKADGEGIHDGCWIVTFDYVNTQFAVHQAFSSGKKSSHQGARDEVSKIVVLPKNTSSASFLGTFSHWRRLFVTANRFVRTQQWRLR